jgi:15-cis-phytoene synthase
MKAKFDKVSMACSKLTTKTYSTSFSVGIHCLAKKFHEPIYGIYGFVRFADEIVDSFHGYDKATLLKEFRTQTFEAIERKISLNPILNSFQEVVNQYNISFKLIDNFLVSMETDLEQSFHDRQSYDKYILGSAEVVGLMCLKVFTEDNAEMYQRLEPFAMKLGAAFQKVNFLRDLRQDTQALGRCYFPNIDLKTFTEKQKAEIQTEIEADFEEGLKGIKRLPPSSAFGVYVAYMYFKSLSNKIKAVPSKKIMEQRIRIPNYQKAGLLLSSYFRHSLRLI